MDHRFEDLEAEYISQWRAMDFRTPAHRAEALKQALLIEGYRHHYEEVELETQVPWYFVGLIHAREAFFNFHAWLHNGDPMFNHMGHPVQTVHVPPHRPPNPACSWASGACDALQLEGLRGLKTPWTPAFCAWAAEKLNGFGYRDFHHMPSPYNWGGTTIQVPGKYVRDREFDPSVMDEQLGAMGVLKLILSGEHLNVVK